LSVPAAKSLVKEPPNVLAGENRVICRVKAQEDLPVAPRYVGGRCRKPDVNPGRIQRISISPTGQLAMNTRSASNRGFWSRAGGVICWLALLLQDASAAEGSLGVVIGDPGRIMADDKVLAEVPKGTRLWIFETKPGWSEVKVPDGEQHGWMSVKEIQPVQLTDLQKQHYAEVRKHYLAFKNTAPSKAAERREHLEACVRLQRLALGDDHPHVAFTINELATLLRQQNDFPAARQQLEQVLNIYVHTYGQEHLETIAALNHLGILAEDVGDYPLANKHYQQVLAYFRKQPPSSNLVSILTNVANMQIRMGEYDAARSKLQEALELCLKIHGAQHEKTAGLYNNYGTLLKDLGDYAEARNAYEKSLDIRRQTLGTKDLKYSEVQTNLAYLLHMLGDHATAKEMLEECLRVSVQQRGRDNLRTALVMNNLANVEQDLGNSARSQQLLEESLVIHRKYLGNEHKDVAALLHNLGAQARGNQDYKTAREFLTQALTIRRQVLGEQHRETADSFLSLGDLCQQQHDYAGAMQHLLAAQAIYQNIFGAEHHLLSTLAADIGLVEVGLKNNDAAFAQWDRSRRIVRRHTQQILPALSVAQQLQYLTNIYLQDWHDSLSFAWLRRDDPATVNKTLAWLINGKAVAQEALAGQQLLARDSQDPQLTSVVRELQQVRQRLASLSLVTPEESALAKHQALQAELTNQEQRLTRTLAQQAGHSTERERWVDAAAIRQALPAGSLYVDLVRMKVFDFAKNKLSEPHYLAWIIPAGSDSKVQIIDLGEAASIERLVEAARAELAAAVAKEGTLRTAGELAATAQATKALQKVADSVLKPLLPQRGDVLQLILSPDGLLWLLPWAALPVDQNQCLLERYSVRYVLSGRDLIKTQATAKQTFAAPAIFANPDFDLARTTPTTELNRLLPKNDISSRQTLTRNSSLPLVEPLPFTALESATAKPMLEQIAGKTPQVFEQAEALEALAKLVRRPQHLLFATHGFFLDKAPSQKLGRTRSSPTFTEIGSDNPLLRCGLLLAGCNAARPAGDDDGILTGMEIVGLDLRGTELVVLSACETGIGRVRNGEGVAGLRQAFQLAGAQSVVSTLWQVPDRDSALIMQDFFTNLAAGQSKAEALRNAQLKRIAARKEKSGAAHPFFWAAWTVTGE
jgi:CHAT domain-containing protein/tetratricopeptide (TPR) repeat protein